MNLPEVFQVGFIISNHFDSFKNPTTEKIVVFEVLPFIVIPFLASILSFCFGLNFESEIRTFITILALFIGFLLNVNILLINFLKNPTEKKIKHRETWRKDAISDTFNNISFGILSAIVIILVIPILYVENIIINQLTTTFIVFMSVLFLLNLILILRRVVTLFSEEIINLLD